MPQPWFVALEEVQKHSYKISTPEGWGTGFLIAYREKIDMCGIATAYHVIDHAYNWEEPIKINSAVSNQEIIIRHPKRVILADSSKDVAVLLFKRNNFVTENIPLGLVPQNKSLKAGNEVGWVGYPCVSPNDFSFFSGSVSCYLSDKKAYLIDGVAINGVSGGAAFVVDLEEDRVKLAGVVSAYIPNRAGGEILPGVCFVRSIQPFYEFLKVVNSLEEAEEKAKEAGLSSSSSSSSNSSKNSSSLAA